MAKELVEIMETFVLSTKEKEGSELVIDDLQEGIKKCRLSLIGKIKGEKVANFTGVRNFVLNAWGYPKKLKIAEIGTNKY